MIAVILGAFVVAFLFWANAQLEKRWDLDLGLIVGGLCCVGVCGVCGVCGVVFWFIGMVVMAFFR